MYVCLLLKEDPTQPTDDTVQLLHSITILNSFTNFTKPLKLQHPDPPQQLQIRQDSSERYFTDTRIASLRLLATFPEL